MSTAVALMLVAMCRLAGAEPGASAGFVPNRFGAATATDINAIYTGEPSSYVSYKTSSGLTVYPAYNVTQVKSKHDRQGVLLATESPADFAYSENKAAYSFPEYPQEDFAAYSPEELHRLQTKCYQFHYHYGPLYDVSQAVNSAASGLRRTVQQTAHNTARKFYTSTNRLTHALHGSVNGFARFMRSFGGKVLLIVVGTGAALLVVSLLQIFFTVASGGQGLFGRAAADAIARVSAWAAARSRSQRSAQAYDAINVLYMLEEAFRKMEVHDYECQQRLMCEAHEAGAVDKYGQVAARLQKIIGSADQASLEGAEREVADAFAAFRDAAVRGVQQRDCQQTYAAKCAKGLRDFVSAGTKY
ncbi:uncharacterized protein LOC119096358 isoform X1 [Pollicipes pollicipes]|uniref:uncharacterized protein LOC119096358 isoform X1 n=1 Tax=Pollicipes pollicipes TaxID=41117 RepID=UPI0018859EE9|nr:uncharacterized protein LOC119096358 isoform X1 [Pollicipes pollicipes]